MTTLNNKNIGISLEGLIYISFDEQTNVNQDVSIEVMFEANDWSVDKFAKYSTFVRSEQIGQMVFNYYAPVGILKTALNMVTNSNERVVLNAFFCNPRKPEFVTITTNSNNEYEMKAPFSGAFNREIMNARVGAHFDGKKKVWIVPVSNRGKAALWNAIKFCYPKAILTSNGRTLQVAA